MYFFLNTSNHKTKPVFVFLTITIQLDIPSYKTKITGFGSPGDLKFLCWLYKIHSMTLGKSQPFPIVWPQKGLIED